MKTHDNQKPYHCSECSRGYNTAAALTSHMQSHKRPHSLQLQLNNHLYSSPKTGETERNSLWASRGSSPSVSSPLPLSSSMPMHKLTSYSPDSSANESSSAVSFLRSSLTLACMYCAKDTFTSMEQLQLHVQAVHELNINNNPLNNLSSPSSSPSTATATSTSNKIVDNNYKRRKKKEDFKAKDDPTKVHRSNNDKVAINNNNDTSVSALMLTCPLCGISCSSPTVYAEHYVLEHCENRKVVADKMTDDKKNYEKKMMMSNNLTADVYSSSTLLCGQCGAALKDFESFRVHLAHHLKINNYQKQLNVNCPKCELNFHTQDEMINHLTKHYLNDSNIIKQRYCCDGCDRYYFDAESLKKHTFDEHTQQLYRCAVCRETFESSVAIQVHFTVKHTRECTVYQCTDCINNPGRAKSNETRDNNGVDCFFKTCTELMKHVINAHLSSSSLSSSSSSSLSLSLSLSSAQEQDRITQMSCGIAQDTTRVCGELFLRCCFCGVHCNTEGDLQRHLATHSTCLYRCPICRQGFTVEFLLDKHIAQIHNNNSAAAAAAVDSVSTTAAAADTMIDRHNIVNHYKVQDEVNSTVCYFYLSVQGRI